MSRSNYDAVGTAMTPPTDPAPRRRRAARRLARAALAVGVSVAASVAATAVPTFAADGTVPERVPAVHPGDPVDAMGRYAGRPRVEDSRLEPAPAALQGVGVDEKLDNPIPLDLVFRNEKGNVVKLGDYFGHGRPVVLQLAYYECPMLCSLVSEGLVKSLDGLDVGTGFDVLTVSIDPSETPSLARAKKQNSFKAMGKPAGASGWDFLVGDDKAIHELAAAVGFRYKYVAQTGQYSHPAVLTVLTSDGRVSNYLYGVQFPPKVMKEAIATAGTGQAGTPLEQFIFTCYQVAHSIGLYSGRAMLLMRLAGVATILALGGALFAFVMKERHRSAAAEADDAVDGGDADPAMTPATRAE